jgi:hypothetical protein
MPSNLKRVDPGGDILLYIAAAWLPSPRIERAKRLEDGIGRPRLVCVLVPQSHGMFRRDNLQRPTPPGPAAKVLIHIGEVPQVKTLAVLC